MKIKADFLKKFPYPFFQYGSKDSTDIDVVIEVPKSVMPISQEERKQFINRLMKEYHLDWNATLAVFQNGVMTDTVYTKAWIDSLNNALFETYNNHTQYFEVPINRKLERNYTLAIYKAVRTVLTFLTRTAYRTEIKSILKGIHPFQKKIDVLSQIDFTTIDSFNQPNASDIDIWKIIAFYIGQNIALVLDNEEFYTKKDVTNYFPKLAPFIKRSPLNGQDKTYLSGLVKEWLVIINDFGEFNSNKEFLTCRNETIDMKNEKY